jgi:hypothetical protein|tara:strand:+ start:4471 stop:4650 length:180 start_codon:yes stop_codon:yes gene_type:complete
MMQFYLTEYVKDGVAQEGPLIMASTLEQANAQAEDLGLKLVGEMFPLAHLDMTQGETIH